MQKEASLTNETSLVADTIEVKILPINKAKVMVQIAKEDRDLLIDLIGDHYSHSISRLAERIGMHGPNVYNALNGSKAVSLAIIDKIMEAIGFQADLDMGNKLIITPRKTEVVEAPKPKSMFEDMPEGTKIEDISKAVRTVEDELEDFGEL